MGIEGIKLPYHTQIYYDHLGFEPGDFVPCEVSGGQAVDVHHIFGRRIAPDEPWNLVGLARLPHDRAGYLKEPFITKEELLLLPGRSELLQEAIEWLEDNPQPNIDLDKLRKELYGTK